jgi:phospholipase/carboxylesterase
MFSILGLHGSHGHPDVIRSFAEKLTPDITCHCPRGSFADGEGFTFFRRNADFSIPVEPLLDIAGDSLAPSGFLSALGAEPLLALGYSSGAIFATALIAIAPSRFSGAILLRPQVISQTFVFPNLSGKPVLIISGLSDTRRKPEHAILLAEQLSNAGADVTHHAIDAGHALAPDDANVLLCRSWMSETFGCRRAR